MNRYYLSQEYEMWSVELDYGDGFYQKIKLLLNSEACTKSYVV